MTQWWRRATGYQIHPRSFADSDGDGIGDIRGIVSKLDYLADLGIGFIRLSPVYRSPTVDNGYDISDYRDIAPELCTLGDFDRLVAEARSRGIGIVMDLVVSHTSDEHAWFVESRASRESPLREFYVWRDPAPGGGPPNDPDSLASARPSTFPRRSGRAVGRSSPTSRRARRSRGRCRSSPGRRSLSSRNSGSRPEGRDALAPVPDAAERAAAGRAASRPRQ